MTRGKRQKLPKEWHAHHPFRWHTHNSGYVTKQTANAFLKAENKNGKRRLTISLDLLKGRPHAQHIATHSGTNGVLKSFCLVLFCSGLFFNLPGLLVVHYGFRFCVFNGLCACVSRAVLLLLLPVCFLKTRDKEGVEFGGWEGSGRREGRENWDQDIL